MRISSYAVARPAYYDRNATSLLQAYIATTTPHFATTRWTTTVASGKKLLVEGGIAAWWRNTAAAVAGEATSLIRVTSGATVMDISLIKGVSNTLSLFYTDKITTQVTLYAGETLSSITVDFSTGGDIQYEIGAKGTTYDA